MKIRSLVSLMVILVCAFGSIQALAFEDGGRGSDDRSELKGTIEALPSTGLTGDWTVSGKTVHVSSATRIEQEHGRVEVGAIIEAKGSFRSDGSFDASKIEVTGQASDDDGEMHFKGTIESLPSTTGFIGDWMVGGRTVRVTAQTRIEAEIGPVVVGAFVEVEGEMQSGGVFVATEIEVKSNVAGGDGRDELKGTIEALPSSGLIGDWTVSGRTVHVSDSTIIDQEHGEAVVGAKVEIHGQVRADGSIDAQRIEVNPGSSGRGDDRGTPVNFKGTIEALPSTGLVGDWTISGKTVHVSDSTRIKQQHGQVAVGVRVKVKGRRLTDGSIDATMIQVKDSR
jgi:predicted outer membrane lipoprotein